MAARRVRVRRRAMVRRAAVAGWLGLRRPASAWMVFSGDGAAALRPGGGAAAIRRCSAAPCSLLLPLLPSYFAWRFLSVPWTWGSGLGPCLQSCCVLCSGRLGGGVALSRGE